ncbi:MAG: hypothetical protein RLZZ478_863 [Actinomycetota bacterium]
MIEPSLFAQGFDLIAGVDEAGRGACAGPLIAASVALDRSSPLLELGVLDSKALSPARREELFNLILASSRATHVIEISSQEIDHFGLQAMNISAMRRAVAGLGIEIDYLISDGYPVTGVNMPTLAMFKGDALSVAVGAASIVAKVTRDRIMMEMEKKFPGYGFGSHKGYSSASHMKAISDLGITEIHRTSYRNVSALLK